MLKSTTVIIPTHKHPTTIKYSIESAQNQTIDDLNIVIIGDGTDDDTRDVINDFIKNDNRITFFDEPKGESRNEIARHRIISELKSDIVTYLGDDDLLISNHIEIIRDLLSMNDFVHPLPVLIDVNNHIMVDHINLKDSEWINYHLVPKQNKISLTGVAHTMILYRNLKFGWRIPPKGVWSDHYMWQQIFTTPNVKLASSKVSTTIKISSAFRKNDNHLQREKEIKFWSDMIKNPNFFHLWQLRCNSPAAYLQNIPKI